MRKLIVSTALAALIAIPGTGFAQQASLGSEPLPRPEARQEAPADRAPPQARQMAMLGAPPPSPPERPLEPAPAITPPPMIAVSATDTGQDAAASKPVLDLTATPD